MTGTVIMVNKASHDARQDQRCIVPKCQIHVLVSRRAHRHKLFSCCGVNAHCAVEVRLSRAHF
jgi:hypothetical protein